jgi:hypothetical protein
MPHDPIADAVSKAAGIASLTNTAVVDAESLMTGQPQPEMAAAPIGPAQSAHNRIVEYIRNFESQLDTGHEVAMGFAGSDAGVLKIEGLGFYDPDLVTFYGRDEAGMKTQLVQHISQLSVLLRAVPKMVPDAPPRRIGFDLQSGWLGGDAGDGSV